MAAIAESATGTYNSQMCSPTNTSKTFHHPGAIAFFLILSSVLIMVSACATTAYQYQDAQMSAVRQRSVVQTEGNLSISASVPGENETRLIFGVPLYDRGIQPVWLEIVNRGPDQIRFAPTGLDPDYFSPLEAAYIFRKGFNKEARAQMDRRFNDSAIPRHIPAGESRSGFVFTHRVPGTKSFTIDLFTSKSDYSFAFFVDVPGFSPDHASVDFESIYTQSDISDHDMDSLREALKKERLSTTDQSGLREGLPSGIVIAADGGDLLKALLRAGWYETALVKEPEQLKKAYYLYGRTPDAVFRFQRDKNDRNELNLWMSPLRVDGKPVWVAQITHFIGQRTQLEQVILGSRIDPEIDNGRNYFVQNMWYAQSLKQFAYLNTGHAVSIDNTRTDFNGAEFFTDGNVTVLWLSGTTVSQLETAFVDWDDPVFR